MMKKVVGHVDVKFRESDHGDSLVVDEFVGDVSVNLWMDAHQPELYGSGRYKITVILEPAE